MELGTSVIEYSPAKQVCGRACQLASRVINTEDIGGFLFRHLLETMRDARRFLRSTG